MLTFPVELYHSTIVETSKIDWTEVKIILIWSLPVWSENAYIIMHAESTCKKRYKKLLRARRCIISVEIGVTWHELYRSCHSDTKWKES